MPKDLDPGQQRVQITTENLALSTLGSLLVCPPSNLSNVLPVIFDSGVNSHLVTNPGVGMDILKERQNVHHWQKLAKVMTSAITGEGMNGEPPFREQATPEQGPLFRSPAILSRDWSLLRTNPRTSHVGLSTPESRTPILQERTLGSLELGRRMSVTWIGQNSTGSWTGHLVPVSVLGCNRF